MKRGDKCRVEKQVIENQTLKFTSMSPRKTNFQPMSPARRARSMSSTVVRSFQPPASSIAPILHIPPLPEIE